MLDRRTLLWMSIEDMDMLSNEPKASKSDAMKLYTSVEDELWLVNQEVYNLWEDKSLLMLEIAAVIQEMYWNKEKRDKEKKEKGDNNEKRDDQPHTPLGYDA